MNMHPSKNSYAGTQTSIHAQVFQGMIHEGILIHVFLHDLCDLHFRDAHKLYDDVRKYCNLGDAEGKTKLPDLQE